MAHIDICYNLDGTHYPGKYCPHDAEIDEAGPVIPDGWTVQQENRPATP